MFSPGGLVPVKSREQGCLPVPWGHHQGHYDPKEVHSLRNPRTEQSKEGTVAPGPLPAGLDHHLLSELSERIPRPESLAHTVPDPSRGRRDLGTQGRPQPSQTRDRDDLTPGKHCRKGGRAAERPQAIEICSQAHFRPSELKIDQST